MLALQSTVGNAAVVQMLREQGRSDGVQAGPELPLQRSAVRDVLRAPGRPLDEPLRAEMESRMGADFSDVRVHTDVAAQRSAAELGARAYTSGTHVVFGRGGTDKPTLAHELTHVIQQRSGPVDGTDDGTGLKLSDRSDRFERAAEANAARVMANPVQRAPAPNHHTADTHDHGHSAVPAAVQRATDEGAGTDEQQEIATRKVLVVCDESGMGLGGVPVFNMELVKGLAVSHNVTMLTVDRAKDYDQSKKLKEHGGAKIVNVPTPENVAPRKFIKALVGDGPDTYGLPSGDDAFDVIIGHSRFSGPGARKIRDAWYPRARLVHFLHTSPVRLDKIKNQPVKAAEKAKSERKAMHRADLVAGVGPLLTQEAERLSQQILRVPAVHEFIPGTEPGEAAEPSATTRFELLLPGRATDEIKGVEAAIRAVGILRKPKSKGGYGLDVRLTVRGGPDPHKEEDREEYARWKGIAAEFGENGITLLPFTKIAAELEKDRKQSHAVIMPSLHEGFGLVATEAAGQSIPVLVNGESGAGQFLARFGELGIPMIVDAPYNVDSATGKEAEGGADQRAHAWAKAIATLGKRLPAGREDAKTLRNLLSQYTWQHAAEALIEAAMATTVSEPDANGIRHGYGTHTRQGPNSTVETVKDHREDWEPGDYWDGSTPRPSTGQRTDRQRADRLKELRDILDLR